MKKLPLLTAALLLQAVLLHGQNVGIGTTTPLKPLHIKANSEAIRIQGNAPWIGLTNNTADSTTYDGFVYFPDTSMVLGTRNGTNKSVILAPYHESI